jgi:hypothetical protein
MAVTAEINIGQRNMVRHIISVSLLVFVGSAWPAPISNFDVYRYSLEFNKDAKVCQHMERVYNEHFRDPWDYRDRPTLNAFPLLENVEPNPVLAGRLRYSKYPSSPEFDAIDWREGRSFFREAPDKLAPTLVAIVDIDNDGEKDLVIKTQFMLSPRPGGGGSPGGEDAIFVLPVGAIDLRLLLEKNKMFRLTDELTPSLLSYMTLHYSNEDRPKELGKDHNRMWATLIRPFVLDGKTYLSVYVPWAVQDAKRRREWTWVMRYVAGGRNLGKGEWEAARVEKICRFRMTVTKN